MTVIMTVMIENETSTPIDDEIIFTTSNGDKLIIKVKQQADPYGAFKEDATPRWDNIKNIESKCTFITETGAKNLFGSNKFKTGRISKTDGHEFEIIEFDTTPTVGQLTGSLRKALPTGIVPLYSLTIVKMEGGLMWIVFKETSTSKERFVVQ